MGCGASVHVSPQPAPHLPKSETQGAKSPSLAGSPKSGYEVNPAPKDQRTNSTSLGATSQLAQSKLGSNPYPRWKMSELGSRNPLIKQGTVALQELSPFSATRPQTRTQLVQKHFTNVETYSKPDVGTEVVGNPDLSNAAPRALHDRKEGLVESRTLSSGVKIRNVHPKPIPSTPETGRFIRKTKRGNSIGFQESDYHIIGGSALPQGKLLETVKERSHNMHGTRTPGTKGRQFAVKLRKNETLEVVEAPQTGSHRSRNNSEHKKMTISNFADYARGMSVETRGHRSRSESNPIAGMPRSKTPKDQEKRKRNFFAQPSQDSNLLEAELPPKRKLVSMRSEMLEPRRKSISKGHNIQIVVNLAEAGAGVLGVGQSLGNQLKPMSARSHGDCSCSRDRHAPAEAVSEQHESSDSRPEELAGGEEIKSITIKSTKGGGREGRACSVQKSQAKQSGPQSQYTFMKAPAKGLTEEDELKAPSAMSAQFKSSGFLGLPLGQSPKGLQPEPYRQVSKVRVRSFRNLLKEVEQNPIASSGSKIQRVGDCFRNRDMSEFTKNHRPPSLQELTGLDPFSHKKIESEQKGQSAQMLLSTPTQRRLKRLNSSGQVSYQAILPTKVHLLKQNTQQVLHRRQESMPLVSSKFAISKVDREIAPLPALKTQQSQNQDSVDKNTALNANLECLLSKENEEDDGSHSLLSRD